MSTKWDKVRLAYEFLKENNGKIVNTEDIVNCTGWAKSSVTTYISKKWVVTNILTALENKKYKINFSEEITWENFQNLHTQIVNQSKPPTPKVFDYDVALSFAGEDRELVIEIVGILKAYDIEVFYDSYETHTLWGKDLYTHLDEVYRVKSKYCVMFLSNHYKEKLWTNHERKSAQARAFEEQSEYILPIRIDDTEIPGITTTIGYIDANSYTPTEIAKLIAKKLKKDSLLEKLLEKLNRDVPSFFTIEQEGKTITFNNKDNGHSITLPISTLIEGMNNNNLGILLAFANIIDEKDE